MRPQKKAYGLGQKFQNPKTKDIWIIYQTQYDHEKQQWRYCMIMANEMKPKIIGAGQTEQDFLYHDTLQTKVNKKSLELI